MTQQAHRPHPGMRSGTVRRFRSTRSRRSAREDTASATSWSCPLLLGYHVEVTAGFVQVGSELGIHYVLFTQKGAVKSAPAYHAARGNDKCLRAATPRGLRGGGRLLSELEGLVECLDGQPGVLVLDDGGDRDLRGGDIGETRRDSD